ncbi:MAG: TetR family transcriptional regulator [Mesorhizobium sp.]|nr:TetR/AcrR family transcriptional regulator [Mesorhizobium sp.]MCO5162242.1 TetR family transcriptional regulator [Mesorhizobium sp.]
MLLEKARQDETKEKIRATARKLMAEKGIENVTIRDIAATAGANVAAINYHFRNKELLTYEVLRDVARNSVKRRLAMLDETEAAAASEGRVVTVPEIVRCFIEGYLPEDSSTDGDLLAKLILKNRLTPTEWTSAILSEEIEKMAHRFVEALRKATPHITEKDLGWRYHFMVGTVVIALNDRSNPGRMLRLTRGECDTDDRAELRRQLEAQLVRTFA